jgi:pentatricopeptide repeat protein
MDAYARSRELNSTQRAVELFEMMDDLGVRRNVYTFSALQNVHARSGQYDAPQKAAQVLDRMLELSNNGDVFAKPNCVNYNAGKLYILSNCLNIFLGSSSLFCVRNYRVPPCHLIRVECSFSLCCYGAVLNAYSRTPSRESARLSDEMLQRMETPVSEGGYDVEPDRLSYALSILACARCPDEMYAAKISEMNLEKMEKRAELEKLKREEVSSAAPPAVALDIECFNVVLTAISKCRQEDAVERTLAIVKRMDAYVDAGDDQIRPNVRSWNAVLNSMARSKKKDAAASAEQMLNHIFDLHKSGVPNVKPDEFSFAAVLTAYQRLAEPAAVQRADDIIRRMEELYEAGEIDAPPDVYHYTIVCAAWAKSHQEAATERCIQILSHMKQRHDAGYPDVRPNVRTYNAVLDCLSRGKMEDQAEQLLYHMIGLAREGDRDAQPDSFSFNSVINAFTRSKLKDGGRRAEAILDRFLEYQEEFPRVKPDARSFTHIVAHYGRNRKLMDAPYRAEYVLNRMINLYESGNEDLAPNLFAVTTVMDAYSHHKHPDAGQVADRMLRLIEKLQTEHRLDHLEPNTGVMNSVLFAWASCGDEDAGRRAEMHLEDMERKVNAGNINLRPNARSYGLVLNALSKSGCFDKAERALQVLSRMKDLHASGSVKDRPNEHAYSLVINACAFTNSGPESEAAAFKIAVGVMEEMLDEEDMEPSSLAFGWFIQACGRLRVPERIKDVHMERAFATCCEKGLVNDFVLHRFKGAAPDHLFDRLVAPAVTNIPNFNKRRERLKLRLSISHLPKEWTKHRFWKRNNLSEEASWYEASTNGRG